MEPEQKDYYSIDEVAQTVGVNRATVYKWIEKLHIQRYRFSVSKKVFLAVADVERLKEVKQKPWLVEKPTPVEDKDAA
jgi:excisionase family DNA binding protein